MERSTIIFLLFLMAPNLKQNSTSKSVIDLILVYICSFSQIEMKTVDWNENPLKIK